MRSIWKGSVNFGMVAIPAKLYTSSEDKKVSFHQYHDCGCKIQMPKWCPTCNRKLEPTEIKKGYEISQDQHIILEESDFASLPLKTLKTVEVMEFVKVSEIDDRLISDNYLLGCDDIGAKAFNLFLFAMENLSVVGISKLCYRDREHLCIIRPYKGIMLLQTLHYADELRAYDEIKPREVSISEKEQDLAKSLVTAMITGFDITKYHNEYIEALESLIEAKVNGEFIATTTEAEKAPVSDVADALIKSLEMIGARV